MSNKVVNKNKLKYMNEFPIIIMIVVAIIVIILAMMYLSIKPHSTIYTNGYMVLSGNMTYNLINDINPDEELNIGVASVSNGDYLYKQMDNYYVGVEKKIEVEQNYPIYSSDGLTIYNLRDDVTLIDRNFEKLKGYPGLSLNYGILYNSDEEEPADDIDYLFLDLNNSVYINAQTMVVKTLMNEYTIPMNSPVYFNTDYISYYAFDGKNFVYNKIPDIYHDSILKIGDVTLTYNEFLLQMELIKLNENLEVPNEEPEEQQPEEPEKEIEEGNNEQENETVVEYVKPSVSTTDFSADVYSATTELKVVDPAGVITSNPMFEIYTMDDKLYSRNRFSSSGKAKLTGLSSNTEYKIVGTYKYKNKEGVSLISTFYEGTIKTKDINSLDEIKISTELGETYSNKIEIKNLNILNVDTESVIGIKEVTLNVWEEDTKEIKEFDLSYSQIVKLKNGEKITYSTPESLKSSTVYEYLFKFYDKDGNELKTSGDVSSAIKTSKQRPKVDISYKLDTKRNEIAVNINTKNPDNLYINDYKYQLYSQSGELLIEEKLDYLNDEQLLFENLDYNSNYILKISGVYDLEDGKGIRKIEEEKSFTTINLKENFTAWYDESTLEVTYNKMIVDVYLGSNLAVLEKADTEIIVYLVDKYGNDILDKNGNLKHYRKYTKNEYSNPNSNMVYTRNEFEGLESNKEYKIKVRINIKQFNKTVFIEKEIKPSITTDVEHAYVTVKSKKLMGNTLSFNLEITDNNGLLAGNGVIIDIYKGKLNSEKDISESAQQIYRKQINVKDSDVIDLNLYGYDEDEYTIFVSSNPYHNINIKKYLSVKESSNEEKTAINVDRQIKVKLEMYEQQELKKSLNELYYTKIRIKYEMPNIKENVFLFDCVNNECLSIGYIDAEKNFKGQNKFYESNNEENVITLSFENKKNDGEHKLYAVVERNLPLSTKVDADPIKESKLLSAGNAYFLATLDYNTNQPIYNISSAEQLYAIPQRNKNHYVVTENLNFKNVIQSNRGFQFYGTIDFQGYSADLYRNNNNVFTAFNRLESTGIIKNAILNYNLYYDGVVEGLPGFIANNYGTIENIIINVKQCREENGMLNCDKNSQTGRANNLGLLTSNNYGTINNFVVNLKSDIHTYGTSSLVTVNNNSKNAVISNGYVTTDSNSKIILYDEAANHATFANNNVGMIKNVYNLVSVVSAEQKYTGGGIATIVRNNNGKTSKTKNTISVATTTHHTTRRNGPNVYYNTGEATQNYYVETNSKNLNYSGKYNEKIGVETLINPSFWEKTINEDGMFQIVSGYYPILSMNSFMEKQQELKPIGFDFYGQDQIDITLSEVIKDNKDGNPAEIKLYISNPKMRKITDIVIDNITSEISQEEIEYDQTSQMSIITLKLSLEEGDKAKSTYNITKLKYEDDLGGEHEKTYVNENVRRINVDIYRYVDTYDQFINSLNDNENIYLTNNISSNNSSRLPNNITYTGILDGNKRTLDLSELALYDSKTKETTNIIARGYFLYDTSFATIKNLQVKGLQIKSNASYLGFIRRAIDSVIENIDISGSQENPNNILLTGTRDTMYVGGLVAYIDHTEINDVSINNLEIKKAEEYSGTIKNNYIGGIVGYAGNSKLQNSYVYDFNVSNMFKDYVFGTTAVGGIVGNNGVTDVINCYSVGKIETEYSYVGGIIGRYSHGNISNNYSYMSISSTGDYLGGIIGWPNPNITIQNNMFIGSLKNNKNEANVSLITPSSSSYISPSNYVLIEENKYKTFAVIEDINNLSQFDANDAFEENENMDDLPYLKETSFVNQKIKKDTFKNNSKLDFTYEIQYDSKSCDTNENVIETDIYKNACATSAKIVFKNKDAENTIIDSKNVLISSVDDKLSITRDENNNIILNPNNIYISNYEIKVKISEEAEEKIINLELPFYRKIASQTDWNSISSTHNENVILLNNIKINNSVETNKKINNLLGNSFSIDGELDIGRASLEDNLIYNILGTMQDVTIKNLNITKDDNTGVGVIKQNEGKILYSNFENIKITNSKNYTGIIAINQGWIKLNPDNQNDNTNLNNIMVSGTSYVGGLIGYNESDISPVRISNIVANDIIVEGITYVGGIISRSNYKSTGIKVSNSTITGKEYVGGIIGYGTVTDSSISNSKIYASGNYVGGVGGCSTNAGQHENINVNKLQIIDNSIDESKVPVYIGGIYGSGIYFNYCTVSELIIGKNIQMDSNTYDTYNGNHIGGISSRSVGVTGCKVDNIKIKGKYNLGGIAANSAASQYGAYNNVVSNSEIIGVSTVGGIFGKFTATTDSVQTIKNNVVINAIISASEKNAGGIVGYMENTNTYSQNMKFLGNLALGVTVNSSTEAGGLIGKIHQVPSSVSIQLKNNLFYGDISQTCETCMLVGNIEHKNTGASNGYGSNLISIEEFVNKSNFKQYVAGEKTVSYQINSLDELNNFMTTINFENKNSDLKYPDEDQKYFPVYIKENMYPKIDEYVEIPTFATAKTFMMMSYSMLSTRSFASSYNNPIDIKFDVYSSGVNKINIEFSDVDDSSYFYYKIGDYISNSIPIDTRTFTVTYDYKTPINVYVTNNFNQKEKTIMPKDIARTISLVNDQTYYISNNSLYSESKMITGNFVNLYNNEALSSDGKIYNIITKQEYDANINYEILSEPVPIYEITHKGNNIKTYYNYSIVNSEVKNMQMFIKNGNISLISGSLNNKKNMYIIDFYNDNEIQIMLKEDGKLYSIKQNIKYPNNFNNSKINELYTDINSTNNIAVLKYENGEVYTFDYRTGELLFTNISKENTSILDYIRNKVGSSSENNIIQNVDGYDKYSEIELLKNKIIDVSIDEAKDKIYNSNNSLNKKEEYIIVYNEISQNYEVFKSSMLLENAIELESETDKISQNYELVKFYKILGKSKKKNSISGIILFTISIILILISLVLLIKNKIFKKGEAV